MVAAGNSSKSVGINPGAGGFNHDKFL